jgi:integrase
VTHKGKQTPLPITDPGDVAGAWDSFRALVDRAILESKPTGRPEPLAALVPEYLESISHRVLERTRIGYESYLRTFVARFGSVQAGQLDAATVEKDATARGWSDTNRANYLWTVQAFIRWAGRKDFGLARPAKESRGAESLVPLELHARVLRETTGDFHQLIRFLWCVGCRPMEGAGLTAEVVDWASGTVTLKAHKMKRKGRGRILYLSTEALAILREQADRHKTGALFRGMYGKPLTLKAIVTRFLRVSEKVGESITAYRYRHTWATRALTAGIADVEVAAMLGHSSTRMLHQHYSHLTANARLLRASAEKLVGQGPA